MDAATPDRIELFAQTRERVSTGLTHCIAETLPLIADDLEAAGERSAVPPERRALFAAAATLRIESRSRAIHAAAAFSERSLRCLELCTQVQLAPAVQKQMADQDVAGEPLAAELAERIRNHVPGVWRGFGQRIGWLSQRPWPDDDLQPLGAYSLAVAACAAMQRSFDSGAVQSQFRGAALERLPEPLAQVLAKADTALIEQGVLPTAMATPADAPPPAEPPDSGEPGERLEPIEPGEPVAAADAPMAAGLPQVPTAPIEGLDRTSESLGQTVHSTQVLASSPFAAPAGANEPRMLPSLQPVLDIERDAVAFAHSIGAVPYSRESRHAFFANVRHRLRAGAATPAQLAVIDVVAAMFDYVIDDRRLPEPGKPLVWRLHQPVIALSLLDPGYMGDEPRSLRRLIENFGAIAIAFADDMVKGGELYRRLETVVRAVEIVASALQTRSAVMAKQVEHEYQRASRNVSQLIERVVNERQSLESTPGRRNRRDFRRRPDRERERLVSERLRELLAERLERHQVPDSVREFVLNVWLRHLRTAVLRDGEDSTEFKVALQVVDDLLWSLDTGKARQSRRELAQRIPALIRLLTTGLKEIGAKDDEHKAFFDELFLIHLRKMQRKASPRAVAGGDSVVASDTVAGTEAAIDPPPPVLRDEVELPREPAAADPRDRSSGAAGHDQLAPAGHPHTGTPAAGEPAQPAAPDEAVGQPADHPEAANGMDREPQPEPAAQPAAEGRSDDAHREGPDQRLLEVLNSIDLSDVPTVLKTREMTPDDAVAAIRRGDWLELSAAAGATAFVKVAWINSRRTVVLLVRHPDRRALSLRMAELHSRFEQRRARLLA